jgi:hypothetical protein
MEHDKHDKQKKKIYKGGDIVRFEPQGLQLLDSNPIFREYFQTVGCLTFCENLQGGHMEVAKQFSMNFDGVKTRVGSLEFQVTEQTIATTTEMPLQGERWFKGMALDSSYCNDYFKPEYQNENLSKGVPRNHMLEHHDKLLRVIQRYFTCEGHFNMVYLYHIRLLMHFTGKKYLNIPYYLCRSLGKMVDKVQAKSKQVEPSLFHFSLIKLLVLEELKKTNGEWSSFLSTSGFCAETISSPPSKGSTPSTNDKATSSSLKRKRGKDKEQQPVVIETPETTTIISLKKDPRRRKRVKSH